MIARPVTPVMALTTWATSATAHKPARLIYRTLRFGTDYVDVGQDYHERWY